VADICVVFCFNGCVRAKSDVENVMNRMTWKYCVMFSF
jgi:Pyruvate/2-oxoacid:ferredoxin oxidoreductase delta subunit